MYHDRMRYKLKTPIALSLTDKLKKIMKNFRKYQLIVLLVSAKKIK